MGVSFSRLKNMYVRVGADKLPGTGKKVEIAKIFKHPNYSFVFNDIAIVELKTNLTFNEKVQPIKLPNRESSLKPGDMVVVTGYGVTYKVDYEGTLEMVSVPIIDKDWCNVYHRGVVEDYMICAGIIEGGLDACQVNCK